MKALLDLLPIGAAVALVSAITAFLLDRNMGLGKWLLAALLFAHGWVHLMFVFPAPEASGEVSYPFDMSRSWVTVNVGLDAGMIRTIGVALMALTLAAFALTAVATTGWLVPGGWWAALVVGSAAGSTLLLVLFFSLALSLGFAINAALWWLVLASFWSPIACGAAGGGVA